MSSYEAGQHTLSRMLHDDDDDDNDDDDADDLLVKPANHYVMIFCTFAQLYLEHFLKHSQRH